MLDWLYNEPSTIRCYFDEHSAIRNAFVAAFVATPGSEPLQSTPSTSCSEWDRAAEGQLCNELQQASVWTVSPGTNRSTVDEERQSILYVRTTQDADSTPEAGPNISLQGQYEPARVKNARRSSPTWTNHITSDAPLQSDSYDLDEQNAEPRPPPGRHHVTLSVTSQVSHTSPPNFRSRHAQVLRIMTSMFGSSLTLAKITVVIRTGDKLIRDDAITFLRDQLPLWKGMWHQSYLPMPSSDCSATDRFVKVSRYICILEERSIMDRVRILFHRVLQYQYYLRALEEVKQKPKDSNLKRKRGVRDATYALNHLLKHLYIHDWDQIGPAEKQTRRDLFHRQKHF